MHGILIFGDSIVAGRGVDKDKSWVHKVTQSATKKDKYNILVYNLGVPGDSTTELLERFRVECEARAYRRAPDDHFSIVIAIGINDSKGIDSPKKFKTPLKMFLENIRKLIKISKNYSNSITFLGLTPVDENKTTPLDNNYFLNQYLRTFNSVTKKVCREQGVSFLEIFEEWIKKDYKKILSEDGVHPNKLGHEKIFQKISRSSIFNKTTAIDTSEALKREYTLSDKDIEVIKSRFIRTKLAKNDLFIGQFRDEKPDEIFGGICIRKDLEGISLNTFYQIFMPLKVASILNVPCKIIVPIQEETILRPMLSKPYKSLAKKLEKGIKQIAKDLNVEVKVINTSKSDINKFFKDCIRKLNLQLSEQNSRYLYNLSLRKIKKTQHSKLRILVNKRVLAGHSSSFMKKISRLNNFVIVEDLEQHKCALYIKNFEKKQVANFLTFLPLPSTSGSLCMFKAEKNERIFLFRNQNYYETIWIKSPLWVLRIYQELFRLVNNQEISPIRNFEWCYKTIEKISKYFK